MECAILRPLGDCVRRCDLDKRLELLFDYQRFDGNDRLTRIVEDTQCRYAGELSDDEIELVSAAGEGVKGVLEGVKDAEGRIIAGEKSVKGLLPCEEE